LVRREPVDEIGLTLPIRETLAKAQDASVAVLAMIVYRSGAVVHLAARASGPGDLHGGRWPLPDISFDGIEAALLLDGRGGHGGGDLEGVVTFVDTFRYWLPLPSRRFRIEVEWPHFGLSGASRYFEPAQFQRAASVVLSPWQP
jgi:hypothetical protein